MRVWIELSLLPVALVVGFALLGTNSVAGAMIALAWVFVLVPHGAQFLIRRSVRDGDPFASVETQYWRSDSRR